MEPLEGDFLETVEGLIFDVKGVVHPHNAVIAYVRYVPHPTGKRVRGGRTYAKLYSLEDREAFLRRNYPQYLRPDPVFNETVQAVPLDRIARYYKPSEKLREMLFASKLDAVERAALELATLIRREAGIGLDSIGVTGSILVGLHSESSDIDLVVVGEQSARKAYEALRSLIAEGGSVRPYDAAGLRRLYEFRSKDTPLPFRAFAEMERKKVLQGLFKGRDFYVRLVKRSEEYGERYGDKVYLPLGVQKVRAKVVDATDSIFTPCRYVVSEVEVLEGLRRARIREIVSLRGRFCELAGEGEHIIARGKLELVRCRSGESYYRLFLGRKGDYMLTLD